MIKSHQLMINFFQSLSTIEDRTTRPLSPKTLWHTTLSNANNSFRTNHCTSNLFQAISLILRKKMICFCLNKNCKYHHYSLFPYPQKLLPRQLLFSTLNNASNQDEFKFFLVSRFFNAKIGVQSASSRPAIDSR